MHVSCCNYIISNELSINVRVTSCSYQICTTESHRTSDMGLGNLTFLSYSTSKEGVTNFYIADDNIPAKNFCNKL